MIRVPCRLLRPRLALANGIAALAGYLLFPAGLEPGRMAAVLGGVALLAAGGSAFNQLQEAGLDRLMVRTRLRPLPAGDLTPAAARAISCCCILAGLLLLAAAGGYLPSLFGVSALVWYLAVYTPLKRQTGFSLAVGALCGAVPPVIGWCVAGGQPLDFPAVLLAGLLYLWQIPHFWLLQRRHAEDYRRAGIPSVATVLDGGVSLHLFRLWLVALVAAAMLLPAFGMVGQTTGILYAVFPLSLLLIPLITSERVLFSCLNLFPLQVTLMLLFQKGMSVG